MVDVDVYDNFIEKLLESMYGLPAQNVSIIKLYQLEK